MLKEAKKQTSTIDTKSKRITIKYHTILVIAPLNSN
jgi:hypothetical protein